MEIETKESLPSTQGLKRTLKLHDLVIFGLIFMAPVAAMSLFGIIANVSKGHSVLSYFVGFIAMLFTASSFGKMVEAFPVAGSTYTYAHRALHPKLGFIAGWGMLLDYFLIPILTYLISANFAHALVPNIPIWGWVIIFAVPVTIVNIVGIEVAAKVNFIFAFLMIAAVFAFVISATHYIVTGDLKLLDLNAVYDPRTFSIGTVISGAAVVIVAYLGFDAITTLSEETSVKSNKIGRAIMITCVIQTILYISVTYLGMVILKDHTSISNPDTVFFNIAKIAAGSSIQTFITLMIIVSGVASALASQSASSRLLYGMGRDKIISEKFFGYLHPTFKTPIYNILLMAFIGISGGIILDMQIISNLVAFGGLFGFICVNLSVINHYYIKNKQRNLSNLLVPLIGTFVCLYVLYGLTNISKLVGICWLITGILYLVIRSSFSEEFKSLLSKNQNNDRELEMKLSENTKNKEAGI
ncbi:APC family permease [Bacillus safensis]|uniref:APC family permease n=1 Tax=Bacillus safensis TaxID=561879 RepID=UPI000B43D329|nr:APC family permease [Bacillus safensis]MCY7493662.1 APC family permease [Bacillus safensis]MED4993105.1 APC family permease [Bacillus safensis]UDB45997.1 APC family permease [Bacillus safensis]